MFFNAENLGLMLKVFAMLIAALTYLLAAHAIWTFRLARSLRIHVGSQGVWIAIVILTALTPLASYYVMGSVRRLGRARLGEWWSLVPVALLAVFVAIGLISVVFDVATVAQVFGKLSESWRININRLLLAGFWFLSILMIVRVFSGLPTLRSIAIVTAITSVCFALLLVPYP